MHPSVPENGRQRATLNNLTMLKHVFFHAVLDGYLNPDAQVHNVANRPGFKMTQFRFGRLTVIDEWCSSPLPHNDYSSGNTTIWMKLEGKDEFPLWRMSYAGQYAAEAIPILLIVLRLAYRAEKFCGGRGLRVKAVNLYGRPGEFVYLNSWQGPFNAFSGREGIIHGGREIGYHVYHGVLLTAVDSLADLDFGIEHPDEPDRERSSSPGVIYQIDTGELTDINPDQP